MPEKYCIRNRELFRDISLGFYSRRSPNQIIYARPSGPPSVEGEGIVACLRGIGSFSRVTPRNCACFGVAFGLCGRCGLCGLCGVGKDVWGSGLNS